MRSLRHWWLATLAVGLLAAVVSLSACDSSSAKAITAPAATTGDVTIAVDRTTYGVTEPIGVTISNATKTDYYAATGHSGCTFLQLEEYNATKQAWVPVLGCQSAQQPQALLIPSKPHNNNAVFTETFTLAPGISASNANAWDVALYRVMLTYNTDASLSKDSQVAYSPGFYVKATP